jgi:hypothetical protein
MVWPSKIFRHSLFSKDREIKGHINALKSIVIKVNVEDRFPGSIGREAPLFVSDV